MHETADDLAALQATIDRSYANAGRHLLDIHTPERRLTAEALCERLQGMVLLTLCTVTADGRPLAGPVDGILYRGAFHFGSATDSVRFKHIAKRPAVSATHLPGEELGITVHGRAELVDHASGGFRQTLLDVYTPRYGEQWAQFIDSGVLYARIDAERVYAFSADPSTFSL